MSQPRPLHIRVFNKDFVKQIDIGAPKFVTVIPRHNETGSATIGLLLSDPALAFLDPDEGARVVIRDEFYRHLMSGRVVAQRIKGPSKVGLVEVDIVDDFALFDGVLGWVRPTQPITAQGGAGTNWTMTGPAETVLKTAVQLNAIDRLGLPVVCATDLGRGATITAKLRWDPLSELFPVIDGAGLSASGIGVTVRQIDDHLVVDVYEPGTAPRILTEESGVISAYSYTKRATTMTRAVVAGAGEGELRLVRTRIAADGREDDIGFIIERYRDARDTDDPTLMYARADESLTEGARKVGLAVEFTQSDNFRYGADGFTVGSPLSISINGMVVISDVLSEATLSWTDGDGWKATPKIGDVDDSTDVKFLNAVNALARGLARLRRV